MLDLISGSGTIEEKTSEEATEFVKEIVEEGVVLAKNEENVLPVASGSKLNVFGWASVNPCYGGTGSGALNDAYPTIDILQGLKDAGIETNTELSEFYTKYKADRPAVAMWQQDWTLPEPNVSQYSDELMANAKEFSDTAMIVITRVGGEGADLPNDMAAVVDGSYATNGRNSGYYAATYDDALNVGGVLLVPGTGQSGFDGFGRVVSGAVNPSGRTVDTYVADMKNTPWWNNFGDFKYTNMSEFDADKTMFDPQGVTASFVNYVEGIYVGYKYYETAAEEKKINYDKEVVYPFGYGLSYTTFKQKMSKIKSDGKNITFSVTVENTGSVAGKEVVEIYMNPPYKNGGIEKASANLLDFAKTGEQENIP